MKNNDYKFYRNKIPTQGIDEEALWQYRKGSGSIADYMVLVDNDQFVTAEPDPEIFYEVEKPKELN